MGIAGKIKLNSIDSLFGMEENISEIPINNLYNFKNHPFKITDDEKMEELIESIKEYGVLRPILIRKSDNGYEIVSGHRRKHACEILGKKTIPAVIRELDDDEATIIMVDSNLQRDKILPSEKAFSYKMKLDAMKRQGKRTDLTSSQVGRKLRSDEQLAEETGESRNQIQRFIRLTSLNKDLLEMVDTNKIPFNTAVELSYLKENEQKILYTAIIEYKTIPSMKQAVRLKNFSKQDKLDKNVIEAVMTEKTQTPIKINITEKNLKKYFPEEYTQKQMEDVIYKLLANWANKINENQ